jgi:hypothetical protein
MDGLEEGQERAKRVAPFGNTHAHKRNMRRLEYSMLRATNRESDYCGTLSQEDENWKNSRRHDMVEDGYCTAIFSPSNNLKPN